MLSSCDVTSPPYVYVAIINHAVIMWPGTAVQAAAAVPVLTLASGMKMRHPRQGMVTEGLVQHGRFQCITGGAKQAHGSCELEKKL